MKSILRALIWLCACLLPSAQLLAQTCAAPGKDGPVTASGVINTYHPGSGSASAGSNIVNVTRITGTRTNTRGLRVGDMILIVQMQDSSTPANAGLHEYARIQSITGTQLTLSAPLVNSYVQSISTGPVVRTFQVVWVPQYSAATITGTVQADRWSLSTTGGTGTGGIVAMDVAGALTLNGTITVAGAGFRGGMGVNGAANRTGGSYADLNYSYDPANANGGIKGEGIEGTPILVFEATTAAVTYSALIGQGYSAGAGGRGAVSNAGGGGNDGDPNAGTNSYNSGGGGGGGGGAGGQGGNSWNTGSPTIATYNNPTTVDNSGIGGNPAGGAGGAAVSQSATRITMGGGGGAGSLNNGVATATLGTYPPTATSSVANGGTGNFTSSGARGGGIVMVRAGSLAGTGLIDASGYRGYNKSPVSSTDSAGGGGAGGSVVVLSNSSSAGAAMRFTASGGAGGSSNYYNHGPGGGGGGGYVLTNFSGPTVSVTGGTAGYDACCGGTAGNISPKPYLAAQGSSGVSLATGGTPSGLTGGASCLPQVTLAKSTTTPYRTVGTHTTATYVYAISNPATAGAAFGVQITDLLPAPFGLTTTTSVGTVTLSGTNTSGPSPTVPSSGGLTSTVRFGVPGGMTQTFNIYPGGQVTVTFFVRLNTTTLATYQNSATVTFIDPTRTTGSAATTTNAAAQPTVTPGGTYAAGGTVGGSNYSASSSTAEDVTIIGTTSLTVTKTNNVSSLNAGQTFTYTLTVANIGLLPAPGTIIQDPSVAGLSCTSITCTPTGGSVSCPSPLTVNALQSTGLSITPTFAAGSSVTFTLTCGVTATGF